MCVRIEKYVLQELLAKNAVPQTRETQKTSVSQGSYYVCQVEVSNPRRQLLGHMRLDQVDRCGEYKWTSKSRQEMEKAKVEVEEKAEEVEIANAEYEKSAFSSKRRRRP